MEDLVRKLNAEYGFNLSEDEITTVLKQHQELEHFLKPLTDMDLTDVAPILKVEKQVKK